MKLLINAALCACLLSACMDSSPHDNLGQSSNAEQSGLDTIKPYPDSDSVCQTIRPTGAAKGHSKNDTQLIACPTHEAGAISDRQGEAAQVVGTSGDWTILRVSKSSDFAAPFNPASSNAHPHYSGKTLIYEDTSHGTQVEYFGPNGTVWLWYPTNTRSLPGQVEFRNNDVCFRYYTNGKNPVTGVVGRQWECSSIQANLSGVKHTMSGDPFGLATGKIPFAMKRREIVPLSSLLQRSNLAK